MRRRSKRLKTAHQHGLVSTDDLPVESGKDSSFDVQQNGAKFRAGNLMFESGSFASRCSVRLINEVVCKFDSSKKELVRSIGFEGLLHFPPMKRINRRFSLWLMSCVDEHSSTLNIAQHIQLRFCKLDVGHVFGILTTGKNVLDIAPAKRDAKDWVIQHYLGEEFNDQRSIKIVQEIVEREYASQMSKEDGDRFRVAFVIFVVSNLLCPSARYDYASVDYWNAIQDPDGISSYDWSGFVITRLLEAVGKLKYDIKNKIKFPNISGCSIFLQVLYLDSIDLEGLSMDHNTLPRVRVFPYDTIRNFILGDNNFLRYCKTDCTLPVIKLRDAARCVYSWACQLSDGADSRSGCLLAIWESVVAMVHLLDIPFEAAGPLFVAVVDFQEQINSGLSVTSTQAVKFLTVLVSIMIPYRRGYRYQSSYCTGLVNNEDGLVEAAIRKGTSLLSFPIRDRGAKLSHFDNDQSVKEGIRRNGYGLIRSCHVAGELSSGASVMLSRTAVGDEIQRSTKCAVTSLDDMPDFLNVDLRVASLMSQFYSVFRKLKPKHDFDLNVCAPGDTSAPSLSSATDGGQCDVASPWELGYAWSFVGVNAQDLFDKCSMMQDDERLAIVHRDPKYVQVSFSGMLQQFMGKIEMEIDLFDALVRVAKQEDDLFYVSHGPLRWRHFFESDVMGLILSGTLDLVDSKLRDHLSLSEAMYDFTKCKLVFFPVLLQFQWACFVWQPENNAIAVFDPSFDAVTPVGRIQLIERACFMLKLALKTLIGSVFIGVACDVTCADVCIMNFLDKAMVRINYSGVLCSMFYRCFDGCDLTPNSSKARTISKPVNVEAVAAKLMYDTRKLRGNSGAISLLGDEVLSAF